MRKQYPEIPRSLALPVRVAAWILLVMVAVPFTGLLVLTMTDLMAPTPETASRLIFLVLGLFILLLPLVAMVLIVNGLRRKLRVAFEALLVCGVLAALAISGIIVGQLAQGRYFGFEAWLGLIAVGLNLIGATLAFRALWATRTPLPAEETEEPADGDYDDPRDAWPASVSDDD